MAILAIDQGTTGTTAVLVDKQGHILDKEYREFTQYYPQPGWVEHDALEIWQTVVDTVAALCRKHDEYIRSIGITNQRETTLIWNRHTGEPVHNAIVWQCRRTAYLCGDLSESQQLIKDKTGLPVDAYFSATKIKWLLEHIACGDTSDLIFGTIDSWLIWKLTAGHVHATDYTNASRTLLLNITEKKWDPELLELFGVPEHMLPTIKQSMDDYGIVDTIHELRGIPINGVAGDQQAALFGQTCFYPGQAKNTYGTGSFMVMNTGEQLIKSENGLIPTIAINSEGRPCYALEGAMYIAGAAIQWLRDEIGILHNAAESEGLAAALPDNGGVYLVPAFAGLGAPHWNMDVRGTLVGLTRGSNRSHIVRSALEAMCYQSYDVFHLMESETNRSIQELMVDGGAVANNFLMQFQADILQRSVVRPDIIESTSLGAAFLAGLRCGFWNDANELNHLRRIDKTFVPDMSVEHRDTLIAGWQHALRQATAQ